MFGSDGVFRAISANNIKIIETRLGAALNIVGESQGIEKPEITANDGVSIGLDNRTQDGKLTGGALCESDGNLRSGAAIALGEEQIAFDGELSDFLFDLRGGETRDLDVAKILEGDHARLIDRGGIFDVVVLGIDEFVDVNSEDVPRTDLVFLVISDDIGGRGVRGGSPAIDWFVDDIKLFENGPFNGTNVTPGVIAVEAAYLGRVKKAVSGVDVIVDIFSEIRASAQASREAGNQDGFEHGAVESGGMGGAKSLFLPLDRAEGHESPFLRRWGAWKLPHLKIPGQMGKLPFESVFFGRLFTYSGIGRKASRPRSAQTR